MKKIEEMACQLRQDIIEMLVSSKSGHPGGSLSAAEILAVLYFQVMNIDPSNPEWPERDRFVLSKGHAAPVLYAVLAEKGYFPREELRHLRQTGHFLQGHPDMKKVPGVDMSTGSLGQGISVAAGMALAGKIDQKSYRVYCVIGDGEVAEGLVWEAAMAAAHYQLDNFLVILDNNGLQIDGTNEKVMKSSPLADKWRSFGWNVIESDGHNVTELLSSLDLAKNIKGKPTIIIAKTIKGKGVSFMENEAGWHGNAPSPEQGETALLELRGEKVNG